MPFKPGNYEHGTMSRFRQHVYAGETLEEIDQACKDARNAHEREYQTRPQVRAKMTRHQKVRRWALLALGREMPERFAELVEQISAVSPAYPARKEDPKAYGVAHQKIRRRAYAALAVEQAQRYDQLYAESDIALMWDEMKEEDGDDA